MIGRRDPSLGDRPGDLEARSNPGLTPQSLRLLRRANPGIDPGMVQPLPYPGADPALAAPPPPPQAMVPVSGPRTPIEEQQAMQAHVRQAITPQPLNDWENMILEQMERGYPLSGGVGYAQRQAVPEELLRDLIRRKYRLGPTAAPDTNDYAEKLRIFENPRSDEISDR